MDRFALWENHPREKVLTLDTARRQMQSNDINLRNLTDQQLPSLDLTASYGVAGIGGPPVAGTIVTLRTAIMPVCAITIEVAQIKTRMNAVSAFSMRLSSHDCRLMTVDWRLSTDPVPYDLRSNIRAVTDNPVDTPAEKPPNILGLIHGPHLHSDAALMRELHESRRDDARGLRQW